MNDKNDLILAEHKNSLFAYFSISYAIIFIIYYICIMDVFTNYDYLLRNFGFILVLDAVLYSISQKNLGTFPIPIISWFVFCAFALISLFLNSVSSQYSFVSMFSFFQLVIMSLCIIYLTKQEKLLNILFFGVLISCLVYAIFFFQFSSASNEGRLFLKNANGDACNFFVGIVSLIYFNDFKKRVYSFFTIILILLFLYLIILTGSRKYFLVASLYLLFFGLFFNQNNKRFFSNLYSKAVLILFISVFIYFLAILYDVHLEDYVIQNRFQTLSLGDEIRIELAEIGYSLIKENFFFGVGYDQFRIYNYYGTYSHNTYIEILSTTGIFGFIFFFIPHIWLFYHFLRFFHHPDCKKSPLYRKYLVLFLFFLFSLFLLMGFVQTSNIIMMIMYSLIFSFLLCHKNELCTTPLKQIENVHS